MVTESVWSARKAPSRRIRSMSTFLPPKMSIQQSFVKCSRHRWAEVNTDILYTATTRQDKEGKRKTSWVSICRRVAESSRCPTVWSWSTQRTPNKIQSLIAAITAFLIQEQITAKGHSPRWSIFWERHTIMHRSTATGDPPWIWPRSQLEDPGQAPLAAHLHTLFCLWNDSALNAYTRVQRQAWCPLAAPSLPFRLDSTNEMQPAHDEKIARSAL